MIANDGCRVPLCWSQTLAAHMPAILRVVNLCNRLDLSRKIPSSVPRKRPRAHQFALIGKHSDECHLLVRYDLQCHVDETTQSLPG
jgi:hypothetical protein